MAKELPFFKFNAGEWLTGNISYESYELQGLFIRVCAEYWNRSNKMTLDDAYLRTNRPELVDQLVQKGYIVKKRNKIFVSFLDEEREIINRKSLKLRVAGRKGGLSSAKARLKHKEEEIEEEKEIDARKEATPHWNRNLKTGLE